MQLSLENTKFIDQYLKKSEIVFDDLRLELVDHVATSVSFKMEEEQVDFYDAFKNYMVENKKTLLKAGMANHTFNFKIAFLKFFQFLRLKEVVVFSVLVLFIAINNFKELLTQNVENIQIGIGTAIFYFTLIWVILFYGIFKKRFFVLENNFVLLVVFFHLMNLSRYLSDKVEVEFYSTVFIGLIIVLFIAFMCTSSIQFYLKNKNLYAVEQRTSRINQFIFSKKRSGF